MSRRIDHSLLDRAKINKNDEFYTLYQDIERELQHYSNHFEGKIIYCNCDDARSSNFFKYFADNFKILGLKKIICSCYKKFDSDLFAADSEKQNGFYYEYTGIENLNYSIKYFEGDGDFRSVESIELLMQSDIVVTNPPFSLFREYISQLMKYKKKFLVISNINAITYKEIFTLIKSNKIWLGINFGRGISGFAVPEEYELYGTETRTDESGARIISPNNCLWLTNLDNFKRHENINLTKHYHGNESDYPFYDNYPAINVNRTADIPVDYDGAMGVPVTFLNKFNPNQFEIISFRKGNDGKDLSIKGKFPYCRILIRKKNAK